METRQYAFRIPRELIERVDKYAKMRARIDKRPCSRSDAIRMLLEQALAPPTAEVIERVTEVIEPVSSETIRGNITDPPFEPVPKKKKTQPPRRRQDRPPGVAFNKAIEEEEGKR